MGCSCGIYGQQVVNPNSLLPVYSLPKKRGGDSAIVVVNVIELFTTSNLLVSIEHWNDNETTHATLGSFSPITAAGVYTLQVTGVKENYCLAFAFGTGVTPGDSQRSDSQVIWKP